MEHDPRKGIRADKLAAAVQWAGVAGGFFRLVKTLGLAVLLLGLAAFLLYISVQGDPKVMMFTGGKSAPFSLEISP